MRNSERIYEAVAGSYSKLSDDPSVLSVLGSCMNQLQSIASYSEDLGELSESFTIALRISLLTLGTQVNLSTFQRTR